MVGPIRMASDFLAVPRRGAPSFDIGPRGLSRPCLLPSITANPIPSWMPYDD